MGTNKHASERDKHDRATPPAGPNRSTDQDHALRAGKHGGATQRRSETTAEPPTRDEGRDDHRSGSEKRRH